MGGGMMIGGSGLGGFVVMLVVAALVIVPFWKLLPRAGLPAWLAIAAVVPFVALILLWVLAFKRWPDDAGKET